MESINKAEKLLFSVVPSILTLFFFLPDFKLLLGFMEVVFGFFGRGKAQKQCYSLVILTNNFCFLRMANFGLFHAVLSL